MGDGGRSAFGALLRHFRLKAGLSQAVLAERARISAETVGALERGARRSPYRDTVELIADALRLDASERARFEVAAARPPRRRAVPPSRAGSDTSPALSVGYPSREPRAGAAPLHNVPAELTSLIGREELVAEVCSLIVAYRLVTLVGSAGIGKTRLALQAAKKMLPTWADGIWLVELASLSGPGLLVRTVARVLSIDESPEGSPLASVIDSLRQRHLLLILDKCENLVSEVNDLAVGILKGCRSVTILATSREPLNLGGERLCRLPSLACPPKRDAGAKDAVRYASVKLFVERARASGNAFILDDENAWTVSEICRQLEGNPLAIEIAAARVSALSPRRLLRVLTDRSCLLTDSSASRALQLSELDERVSSSFAPLSEPEKLLAFRLGIFAEGWTLEAAEAVCASHPLERGQVLDLLAGLVDKSLVGVELRSEEEHYQFPESLRAFARAELAKTEEREAIERRYLEWVEAKADTQK